MKLRTSSSDLPASSMSWTSRRRSEAMPAGESAIASFWHCTQRNSCVSPDRKSTRLNSSHLVISYAVFCLKKKNNVRALQDLPALRHQRDGGGQRQSQGFQG